MNEEQINAIVRQMENELSERWALLPRWLEESKDVPKKLYVDEIEYVADESLENDTAVGVFASLDEAQSNFAGFVVSWLVDRINQHALRSRVAGEKLVLKLDAKSEIEHEWVNEHEAHRFTASVGFAVVSLPQ